MNIKRANEILHGTGVIDVTHNGTSVWLKVVHEEDGTVEVEGLDDDYGTDVVKAEELSEQ